MRTGSVVRRGWEASSVVVLVTALVVSALPVVVAASTASAAATGPASSSGTIWAYGALRQQNYSGTVSGLLGVTYAYKAEVTYGFSTILNETQPSAGTYQISSTRVMGSILSITFCRPSCSVPLATGTIYHRAFESLNASATLTTAGNVTSGGLPVPALALQALALNVTVGLRESAANVSGGVVERSHALSATLEARDALDLTPALGLFPLSVAPGQQWNSSSAYVQTGNLTWNLSDSIAGNLVRYPGTYVRNGTANFSHAGTVDLSGADQAGPVTLGGGTFQALNLSVANGGFVLREGWLLLPLAADAFGGSTTAWQQNESGFANTSQANIDIGSHVLGADHLAVGGSGEWWLSHGVNPASTASVTALSPAAAPATSGSGGNATYVQGVPEAPSQAAAYQNCLAAGTGCPGGAPGPRGLLGLLVVVGVAGLVALSVVVLAVGRRRAMPPTVFPNAALYPPGQRTASANPPAAPPSGEPAKEEDDPLGHLW